MTQYVQGTLYVRVDSVDIACGPGKSVGENFPANLASSFHGGLAASAKPTSSAAVPSPSSGVGSSSRDHHHRHDDPLNPTHSHKMDGVTSPSSRFISKVVGAFSPVSRRRQSFGTTTTSMEGAAGPAKARQRNLAHEKDTSTTASEKKKVVMTATEYEPWQPPESTTAQREPLAVANTEDEAVSLFPLWVPRVRLVIHNQIFETQPRSWRGLALPSFSPQSSPLSAKLLSYHEQQQQQQRQREAHESVGVLPLPIGGVGRRTFTVADSRGSSMVHMNAVETQSTAAIGGLSQVPSHVSRESSPLPPSRTSSEAAGQLSAGRHCRCGDDFPDTDSESDDDGAEPSEGRRYRFDEQTLATPSKPRRLPTQDDDTAAAAAAAERSPSSRAARERLRPAVADGDTTYLTLPIHQLFAFPDRQLCVSPDLAVPLGKGWLGACDEHSLRGGRCTNGENGRTETAGRDGNPSAGAAAALLYQSLDAFDCSEVAVDAEGNLSPASATPGSHRASPAERAAGGAVACGSPDTASVECDENQLVVWTRFFWRHEAHQEGPFLTITSPRSTDGRAALPTDAAVAATAAGRTGNASAAARSERPTAKESRHNFVSPSTSTVTAAMNTNEHSATGGGGHASHAKLFRKGKHVSSPTRRHASSSSKLTPPPCATCDTGSPSSTELRCCGGKGSHHAECAGGGGRPVAIAQRINLNRIFTHASALVCEPPGDRPAVGAVRRTEVDIGESAAPKTLDGGVFRQEAPTGVDKSTGDGPTSGAASANTSPLSPELLTMHIGDHGDDCSMLSQRWRRFSCASSRPRSKPLPPTTSASVSTTRSTADASAAPPPPEKEDLEEAWKKSSGSVDSSDLSADDVLPRHFVRHVALPCRLARGNVVVKLSIVFRPGLGPEPF